MSCNIYSGFYKYISCTLARAHSHIYVRVFASLSNKKKYLDLDGETIYSQIITYFFSFLSQNILEPFFPKEKRQFQLSCIKALEWRSPYALRKKKIQTTDLRRHTHAHTYEALGEPIKKSV